MNISSFLLLFVGSQTFDRFCSLSYSVSPLPLAFLLLPVKSKRNVQMKLGVWEVYPEKRSAILNYVQKTNIKFIETMKKLHDDMLYASISNESHSLYKNVCNVVTKCEGQWICGFRVTAKKKNGVCLLEGD